MCPPEGGDYPRARHERIATGWHGMGVQDMVWHVSALQGVACGCITGVAWRRGAQVIVIL